MMINIHEVCGQLLGILSIQARDQVNDLIDQIRINDKNDLLLFVGRLENTINFLSYILTMQAFKKDVFSKRHLFYFKLNIYIVQD